MPSDPPGESPELPDELARLPHGRHGLPPEFVERNQRQRLLASLVRALADSGYNAATITGIAEGAGVTTRTFYKYFDSVEACYLSAFDTGAELLGERLVEAWATEEDWPARVRSALAAALDFFAGAPELASLLLTEPFVAGPDVAARYRAELARLVPYLREGRVLSPEGPSFPETTERGLIGSLASRIGRKVTAGEAAELPSLLADLTQFTLTPYLGVQAAKKAAAKRSR
ncbi:MAG TPA: TetR/AcrR family transcriptional regulator [Solirubrobacterales bacterium]|nr:TetR/AcrR family transcriptional regulator [Solirubrobacterales bacterium]